MNDDQKIILLRKISSSDLDIQRINLLELNNIVQSIQFIRYKFKDEYFNPRLHDGNLLFQKAYLHGLSILLISNGLDINIPKFRFKSKVNDPISVSILERGLIETYLTFYYTNYGGNDDIINTSYLSWIIHGLLQRQKIKIRKENNPYYEMHLKKLNDEKAAIDRNVEILSKMKPILNLKPELKTKYLKDLKNKWKFEFFEDKYKPIGYQDILNKVGIKSDLLKNLYNHLSWSAHSTSIGISQFEDLWSDSRADILFLKNSLIISCAILAFMSRDVIINDPDFLIGYKDLSSQEKNLLNFYNYHFRGETYTIDKL